MTDLPPNHSLDIGAIAASDREKLRLAITSELERMRHSLRKDDIDRLAAMIAHERDIGTNEALDGLHRELLSARDRREISDESLQSIQQLIQSARDLIESELSHELSDLKALIERGDLNTIPDFEIKQGVYFSQKFPVIAALENSRLGESFSRDLLGFFVGATDSLYEIVRTIVLLIVDTVRLPYDLAQMLRKK